MRTLGGSIGLASGVIVFNTQIKGSVPLAKELTQSQLHALYKSPLALETFSKRAQQIIPRVYADAFTKEMQMALYVAIATFLVSLLTLERHPPFKAKGPPKPEKKDGSEEGEQPGEKKKKPKKPKAANQRSWWMRGKAKSSRPQSLSADGYWKESEEIIDDDESVEEGFWELQIHAMM